MFETCVDQLVKVTLMNQPITTEWFHGTLFVQGLTDEQADQVLRVLSLKEIGRIEMHQIGNTGEFAYDFV